SPARCGGAPARPRVPAGSGAAADRPWPATARGRRGIRAARCRWETPPSAPAGDRARCDGSAPRRRARAARTRVRCPSPAPPEWRRLASVDRHEEAAEADRLWPFPWLQPSRGRRVVGEEDELGAADQVLGRYVPAELVA